MSSFGRLTGFGLKGKESVNAPFSAEQLTIKAELLAIAEASQSDILAKLQEVAPNTLQAITSERQAKDRAYAQAAAEAAHQEPTVPAIPIERAMPAVQPAEAPEVAAARERLVEVLNAAA